MQSIINGYIMLPAVLIWSVVACYHPTLPSFAVLVVLAASVAARMIVGYFEHLRELRLAVTLYRHFIPVVDGPHAGNVIAHVSDRDEIPERFALPVFEYGVMRKEWYVVADGHAYQANSAGN